MQKTINKPIGFLLAGLLLLAACAQSPAGQDLIGTSWVLVSLDGNPQIGKDIGGQAVTLSFDTSTQAGGSGGCNSFGAKYDADPSTGSISFSEIVSTLMACLEQGVGNIESAYLAALDAADHYRTDIGAQTLTITGGGHTLVFERTSEGT